MISNLWVPHACRQEVSKQVPARLILALLGSPNSEAVAHTAAALADLSALQPSLLSVELLPALLQLLTHATQGKLGPRSDVMTACLVCYA